MVGKILAIFFHPDSGVTAVGGAEKRFIEILKVWNRNVPITVLESNPSIIERYGINTQHSIISSPVRSRNSKWLGIYFEWILWSLKSCFYSLYLTSKRSQYEIILSTNNTLPTLVTAYFYHLMLLKPVCVVVHHLDVPTLSPQNSCRVYEAYRKAGYSRNIAFIKTCASQLMLFLLKRVDACIAVSASTAHSLVCRGVPRTKLSISSNGVDFKYIDRINVEERKLWDGIFVGRISREKGIFDLVVAWKKIVVKNKNSRLIIIGNGPDRKELERSINRAGLRENVLVKGSLSDEDMFTLMKMSKILVFPSRFEGWGLTVAEALASGLPVICYDIPALREVFGKCSSVFFVPIGDVEELVRTFFEVVRMNERMLTETSKSYARMFDWNKVARKDLQIMASLIAKK